MKKLSRVESFVLCTGRPIFGVGEWHPNLSLPMRHSVDGNVIDRNKKEGIIRNNKYSD